MKARDLSDTKHTFSRVQYIAPIFALFFSFLLFSCAGHIKPTTPSPSPVQTTLPRGQKPYRISGIWYYPIPSAQGYSEAGIASWYGDDFHGKPTSSGEIYDMYAMTAAHKVLPLGTHVKVTNRSNGASVILRVNDRGPFVSGRIIDLSYTAAHKLGMLQPGTIPVKVEAVRVAEQTRLAGKTVWNAETVPDFRIGNFSIQLGAFQQIANAHKLRVRMQQQFGKASVHSPATRDRDRYFRVQVGQYQDLQQAQHEADRLKQQGYPGAFVVALDETAR